LNLQRKWQDILSNAQRLAVILAFGLVLFAPGRAAAQVEVEADPIAWALNGYSLHVAKLFGQLRVNVGAFGVDVPTALHGNDGWESTMRGAGVKIDYLGASRDGFFMGVEGGYMRYNYLRTGEIAPVGRDVLGAGVRGGYRLLLGGRGLYVVPWVGVGYNINGDDVVVAGERFDRSAITVFPTVHLGWRF